MRLVFFGSGSFGLPTLRRLVDMHDVALVVTQPDRPAGRKRVLTPTPIGEFAAGHGLPIIRPETPNLDEIIERVHAVNADAYVVIAYGHKLKPELLGETFAINLHGSLLPKYRGAAPINWAMIEGETETGVSVITLAQRMDAGEILAQRVTPIDPHETAGELHDRLAGLGPEAFCDVLASYEAGTLQPITQSESLATPAPKLSKRDGTVDFDQPAARVRARVHGLTPWPGCAVRIDGREVKLIRVEEVDDAKARALAGAKPQAAGTIVESGVIVCNPGAVRVLEIQPPGKRIMTYEEYQRGHPIPIGAVCEKVSAE
jgi:methionyl-tRNA formyltransferase